MLFNNIITEDLKNTFTSAIEALLADSALTVPCKLVYENTKLEDCPNCIYDSISKKSSNQYQTGGPIYFVDGQICPYCSGFGSLSFKKEEDIYLGIIKPAFFGGSNLDLNGLTFVDGMIQSLCGIVHYAKIKRASHIIIDTNLLTISNSRFIRYKDPTPIGFGNNAFIITTWQGVQ